MHAFIMPHFVLFTMLNCAEGVNLAGFMEMIPMKVFDLLGCYLNMQALYKGEIYIVPDLFKELFMFMKTFLKQFLLLVVSSLVYGLIVLGVFTYAVPATYASVMVVSLAGLMLSLLFYAFFGGNLVYVLAIPVSTLLLGQILLGETEEAVFFIPIALLITYSTTIDTLRKQRQL